jgi:hypothetical protein
MEILMKTINKSMAICVLTARGIEKVLADGGSQAWVLDAKRARKYEYVVCVQNRGFTDDWGHVSAPHHTAFLVGRLKDVVRSPQKGCENRWLLTFSEYAEVDVPDAWPGFRNPVLYTDLEDLRIDVSILQFQPMPEQEPEVKPEINSRPLTLAEAKAGLALTFEVTPADIEITIRG